MTTEACACRRCGGMMIATYTDLLSPGETGEHATGWRCVNCGEYVDHQVLLNRSGHLPPRDIQHRSIPQRARTIQVQRRIVAA